MTDLSAFPITRRCPPQHPDRLQLYSRPTANGVKLAIMLEEIGLPYEVHRVNYESRDQHSPEFPLLSPNNKIPAMIDPDGPGGRPIGMFESGAMLYYLAEKTGKLIPADAAGRYEALQWVMFQMAGIAPTFGQVGYFVKNAGREIEDKRPRDRYVSESRRLLRVLNTRLSGREWLLGPLYSIADIATFPWVRNLVVNYGAGELVGIAEFPEVTRALQAFVARPAVVRGLNIPPRLKSA